MTFDFYEVGLAWEIYPTPSSFTKVNSIFSTSFRLFIQIVCLLVCLQGPLEGIILVVQVHKIIFTPIALPRGIILRYFFDNFCVFIFFFFLYFLRIIQLLHIKFFTNILSITLRITSLKKNIRRISNFVGSHFGIFWGSFWDMFLYSSELLRIFWAYFLMKLCTYVFCITLTVNVLRTSHIPLLRGLHSTFGLILGIFLMT